MYYTKVHQEASTTEEEEMCVICTYQHLSKVSNYFVHTSCCVNNWNLCPNYMQVASVECATRGTTERAHGLGVMGNARTGITSTVLDSPWQMSHQREIGFVPSVVQLLTNTQLLLWWLCSSCIVNYLKLNWMHYLLIVDWNLWNVDHGILVDHFSIKWTTLLVSTAHGV